jgi:hypothetical protein
MKTSLLVSFLCTSLAAMKVIASAPESAKPKTYSGEITTTSEAARTITVRQGEKTRTFAVDDDTKLSTEAKASAQLEDFKMGQKKTVEYTAENDRLTALSVCDTAAKRSQ